MFEKVARDKLGVQERQVYTKERLPVSLIEKRDQDKLYPSIGISCLGAKRPQMGALATDWESVAPACKLVSRLASLARIACYILDAFGERSEPAHRFNRFERAERAGSLRSCSVP